MEFEITYKVIDNHHEGYCSGSECEESENLGEVYSKNIILPIEFKPKNELVSGEIILEGPLFDMIKNEESYEETLESGSQYCHNSSERFDIHTRNYIVDKVVFIKYV